MDTLHADGLMAKRILPLTQALLIVSAVVVVIITALVLIAILRRGRGGGVPDTPIEETGGWGWISIGVGFSTIVLVGLVVWTSMTMARIANPPDKPALSIDVRGHQWWWEFVYQSDDPSKIFTTANEIHIPVGKPVRFTLNGEDVIHTFWVPSLGGKIQLIPGQTNITWLQADRPGVYRGQCSQFCGQQHAHMIFSVFADAPDAFEAWREDQLRAAPQPVSDEMRLGEQRFIGHCGVCHTVRGTPANGHVGPDLTHLMSRTTIAGGELPNNPGFLSGWVANPQGLKPGSLMPDPELSGPDLASIRSFLVTLK
ncbi:MAG: cytochrome c oxidase subunit II [Hyphomicrobiales bacterium]|nr:cytochrome c oxidase subunit II [Hyphomicrobiales bacterium]